MSARFGHLLVLSIPFMGYTTITILLGILSILSFNSLYGIQLSDEQLMALVNQFTFNSLYGIQKNMNLMNKKFKFPFNSLYGIP